MRTTDELKDKTFKFRASEELAKKIDDAANRKNISTSELIRLAIREYLK